MSKNEIGFVKGNKRKLITMGVFFAILLAVVLGIFAKGYISAKEKYEDRIKELEAEVDKLLNDPDDYDIVSKEVSLDVINTSIQSIGELATLEYLYTDAGKFSDPKDFFGKDIPLAITTKTFIAKWDGSIKAGIDVEKIFVEIEKEKKEIIVHIPKAEILPHEIDDESIETLDEKDGLFNPIKIDDIRQFDSTSKIAMEERAIENGILDKAQENAQVIIYKLINVDVVAEQGYNIVFKVIEE